MCHKPSQGFLDAKNWYLYRKAMADFLIYIKLYKVFIYQVIYNIL